MVAGVFYVMGPMPNAALIKVPANDWKESKRTLGDSTYFNVEVITEIFNCCDEFLLIGAVRHAYGS